jgi:hypothetical protein
LDWRPGRVYFLTILEPLRDDRTPALPPGRPARWHSTTRRGPRSTYLPLMPPAGRHRLPRSRRRCAMR